MLCARRARLQAAGWLFVLGSSTACSPSSRSESGASQEAGPGAGASRPVLASRGIASGMTSALTPSADGTFTANGAQFRLRIGVHGEAVLMPATPRANPASLSIESVLLRRGAAPVRFAADQVEKATPSAVVVRRGEALERFEVSASELEQSWTFARPPAGTGPLTVRVRAHGLAMRDVDAAGLHFRDAAGSGYVYGHATWIDAKGRRTVVRAQWVPLAAGRAPRASRLATGESATAGEIELSVPEAVLRESVFPAALDPSISPEFALGHAGTGATEGDDAQSSVAFDGTNYFVVWHDGSGGGYQVKGTRVTPSGAVLDPGGITIAGDNADATEPKIAFDGTNYLVIWKQTVPMPDGSTSYQVHGVRVSSNGTKLDSPEIEISSGSAASQAKVAFCGSSYFVVWQGNEGPFGAHVGTGGTVLDKTPITLPAQPFNGANPMVSRASSGCLVTWTDSTTLKASRIGNSGPLLDTGGFQYTLEQGTPAALAFDGTNNLAIWTFTLTKPPYGYEIHAVRVAPSGAVIDSPPNVISQVYPVNLVAAWDGANYVLAWMQSGQAADYDLYGVRVSAGGTRVDGTDIPISLEPSDQALPALAAGPTGVFLTWQDASLVHLNSGDRDIFGTRIDGGAVLDKPPILISTGASSKDSVAIASDGTDFFAAWRDDREKMLTTNGQGVSASGAPFATSDLVISDTGSQPVVADTGTSYLVAWLGGARRVGYGGDPMDTTDIPLPPSDPATTGPTLACGHLSCLAAWSVHVPSSTTGDADIEGAIILPDGTAKPTIAISTSRQAQVEPAVASDGKDFVVVWTDCRDDPTTDYPYCTPSLYAARVSADGSLLDGDASALQIPPPRNGVVAVGDRSPAIAYDAAAKSYLVVWAHDKGDAADIWGAHVRPQSTVLALLDAPAPSASDAGASDAGAPLLPLGVIRIAVGSGEQAMPRVAYSGDGYHSLVVWEDRSGSSWDIFGNWVTTAGIVVDKDILPIGTGDLDDMFPVVTANRKGSILVAYGMAEKPTNGNPRITISVAGHVISTLALDGSACAKEGECASGSCRDGVCCDGKCDGECQACNGATPGVCTAVKNAEDDSCSGQKTCDDTGTCRSKIGTSCTAQSDCVPPHPGDPTGFCSDGYCCSSACAAECDTCAATPGTCTLLAKGTAAAACVLGNVCDGQNAACPTTCSADPECATGYYCSVDHHCAPPCTDNSQCPSGILCNKTSGRCETGGSCQDDHTVLKADGTTIPCDKYACRDGACKKKCANTLDCALGFQCNESGACEKASAAGSASSEGGCSASRGRANGSLWALALLLGVRLVKRRRWTSLAVAVLGCSAPRATETPSVGAAPTTQERAKPAEAPPKVTGDLEAVRRRAHFAYRSDGKGSFSGGDGTYSARISDRGALTLSAAGQGKALDVLLETTSIRRGSRVVAGRARPAERREDGSVVIRRGSILETMQNGPAGVEQSFSFVEKPSGNGDLSVHVRVSGAPAAAGDGGDLLFSDPTTGLGVRYGHAAWIDARGRRTAVRAQFVERRGKRHAASSGEIIVTVPSAVLAESRYPAVLDPTIGPELPLAAAQLGGTSTADSPAVATDGTYFLVVFHDYDFKNGPAHAVLIDKIGKPLDAHGVPLPGGNSPAVASDATEYLVVWEDQGDIKGVRVDRAGQVIDSSAFSIAAASDYEKLPSVAWCGASYLVVWSSTQGGVFGVHVDSAGRLLEANPFQFGVVAVDGGAPVFSNARDAVVASNGTECLVAWADYGVFVSRVPSQGRPLDALGTGLPGSENFNVVSRPAVASDGHDFFVVVDATPYSSGLFGARVSEGGKVLDAPPLDISGSINSVNEAEPSVVWDGQNKNYLVTWTDAVGGNSVRTVQGRRWTSSGTALDPDPTAPQPIQVEPSSSNQTAPGLVSVASSTFLVWNERSNIFESRLGADGVALDDPVLLSVTDSFQDAVALASDGTGYFAAWHDTRAGQDSIFGTRLGTDGRARDSAGIEIATGPYTETSPVVAYDEQDYFVAWFEALDRTDANAAVRGARISILDGTVGAAIDVDPSRAAQTSGGLSADCVPKCLSNGCTSTCLVAWTQGGSILNDRNIGGALVESTGKVTGFPISNAVTDQVDPCVTSDGTDFLVVWTQIKDGLQTTYGGRIKVDGLPLDGKGIPLSTSDVSEHHPSAAYDPVSHQYLVVWDRGGDIQGTRLVVKNDALTVLDLTPGLTVTAADGRQTSARVVNSGDGHNLFAVWQSQAIGATTSDVYGAWINRDGDVFGAGAISASSANERAPAVASRGGGALLVAYEVTAADRLAPTTGVLGSRVVSSDGVDGTTCKANTECASRLCRDGYCCERECDTSCETCGDPGSPGVCTCKGDSTCTRSNTQCAKGKGASCANAAECVTGFCVDGYCCESECTGACNSCAVTPGSCSVLPKGSLGRTTADAGAGAGCTKGYLCDGVQPSCPKTCQTDDDCGGAAPGYHCSNGECTTYCIDHRDCPGLSTCDKERGMCSPGGRCEQNPDGTYQLTERDPKSTTGIKTTQCGRYVCSTKDQACLVTCTSSRDCSPGNQCDVNGACSIAEDPTSNADAGCGCRLENTRGAPADWRWLAGFGVLLSLVRRRRGSLGAILGIAASCVASIACASHKDAPVTGAHRPDGGKRPVSDAGHADEGDGSTPSGLGASCTRDDDCPSRACVHDRCTKACTAPSDCPPAPEWSCAFAPGHGAICSCAPSGPEVCDGRDNDCNGVVDDGAPCTGSLTCESGQCVCPPENKCGGDAGECVDTTTDVAHCGGCDIACPIGSTCAAGKCVCPAGETACDGKCFDLGNSALHCGSCGTACSSLERCVAGNCKCADTLCDGTCVSLSHDAQNCGGCGRNCGGSACVDAECAPIPLVVDEGPLAIAVDETSVYWLSPEKSELQKADLDGKNPIKITDAAYLDSSFTSMAVSGSNIYWVNGYGIAKAPIDGSAAPSIIVGSGVQALAVDATHLYYTNGSVYRTDLNGGNVTLLASDAQALDLVVSDGTVYWATSGYNSIAQVHKVGVDGTSLATLAVAALTNNGSSGSGPIGVDSTRVYFGGYYGATTAYAGLFSADKDGRNRKLLANGNPAHLLVGERAVYFIGPSVYEVPLGGGEPRIVAPVPPRYNGSGGYRSLVEDADFVYFCLDSTLGGIWKIAK